MSQEILKSLNEVECRLNRMTVGLSNRPDLTLINDDLHSLQPTIQRLKKKLSSKDTPLTKSEVELRIRLGNIVLQYKNLGKEVRSRIKKSGVASTNIIRTKPESTQVVYDKLSSLDFSAILKLRDYLRISSMNSRVSLKEVQKSAVSTSCSNAILFKTASILLESRTSKTISFTNLIRYYLVTYYREAFNRELSTKSTAICKREADIIAILSTNNV